jgi:hypothetical protein
VKVDFKHVLAIILSASTLFIVFGLEPSEAIEDLKVYRGVLVIEGVIVSGDYNKVRNFLREKSNFDKINGGVFLASPGGNVGEAIKIGLLIRSLRLTTDAPSGPPLSIPKFGESLIRANDLVKPKNDYLCVSACFMIYVAGIDRKLNWAGRLGLHRPMQLESNNKRMNDDAKKQLSLGVRQAIDNYLRAMNLRIKYIDLMFSIPPNEIRWITQNELESDFQGLIPELKDVVDAKCNSRATEQTADKENNIAVTEKQIEISKCRIQVQTRLETELPIEAWRRVFGGKQGP